jgi:hypothetical protein
MIHPSLVLPAIHPPHVDFAHLLSVMKVYYQQNLLVDSEDGLISPAASPFP